MHITLWHNFFNFKCLILCTKFTSCWEKGFVKFPIRQLLMCIERMVNIIIKNKTNCLSIPLSLWYRTLESDKHVHAYYKWKMEYGDIKIADSNICMHDVLLKKTFYRTYQKRNCWYITYHKFESIRESKKLIENFPVALEKDYQLKMQNL